VNTESIGTSKKSITKLRAENCSNNVVFGAAKIRFVGMTRNGLANVWSWECGCCGSSRNHNIDTLFVKYSTACTNCYATNTFDFAEHGAGPELVARP
jgi:hypothetical protein